MIIIKSEQDIKKKQFIDNDIRKPNIYKDIGKDIFKYKTDKFSEILK